MISSSTITFSRLSGPNSPSLISGVVVNPVSSDLNGTVVNCFEGSTSTDTVSTTTIQVIDLGPGQFDLSIQNRSEDFLSDEVTVNLGWTFINLQTYYQQLLRNVSVSAKPKLRNVTFNGNMTVQLVLSYNTLYNVSVTQHSICQQLIRTKLFELKYSKCSDPMEVTNARALGYVDPALEGQNIIFICPSPGQAISGPNSSICMGNGEWDPDPGEVECTGPESTTTSNYATMQLTDCMTCSGPNTDTTLGVVLGIIFGIILASTITFVVVLIIILNKKRITGHLKHMHPLNTNVELDTHDDNHNIKDEGTLVYADIGQHPAPVKSNTIHLDDSRVEYALLDHSTHKNKASTLQESSTAKESGAKHDITQKYQKGMIGTYLVNKT